MKRLVWCFMLVGLTLTAAAQRGTSLAFRRAEHLRHGINISMWYAQTKDFSAARLDSFVTTADFAMIKKLGFDHVRLSIDPEWLIDEPMAGTLKPAVLSRLDKTVAEIEASGLSVILDVHPEESFKSPLERGEQPALRFLAFWEHFARHFSASDPEHVMFELLNEPTMEDLNRWEGLQARAVARIRAAAPQHTILATSSLYSKIDTLVAMEPVRDENVIYTFHEYDPMWFTHQGASWGLQEWAPLRGVTYPSSPESVQKNLDQESDERRRLELERFGLERWDAKRLGAEIAAVARWAQRRGVPLYCGEFGVFRAYADPESRATWISDVRTALESKQIGWAMWDWDGGFGAVTKQNGTISVDMRVIRALGLAR